MATHTIKHNAKLLKRVFDGLPVVDAKRELRIFADRKDIDKANRKDPTNCALAKACQRLYGSHSVAFFRTIAYVDLLDPKGKRRIERFILTNPTRRSIAKFDKTGKINPAGYHLLPPSHGSTMDHRLAVGREYEATRIRKPTSTTRKEISKNKIVAEVRSGKGLVQFIGALKDWTRYAKVAVNK